MRLHIQLLIGIETFDLHGVSGVPGMKRWGREKKKEERKKYCASVRMRQR